MLNGLSNRKDIEFLIQQRKMILNAKDEIQMSESISPVIRDCQMINFFELSFKLWRVNSLICKAQGHIYIDPDLSCITCGHKVRKKAK
jgi:hypothetical protein